MVSPSAAIGQSVGEVVFNIAITGYQEILTDPSYCKQIVTLTQPHIGNVGCNPEAEESGQVQVSGLVIKDLPLQTSSWRADHALDDYLKQHDSVAIVGIDTRRLIRILRDKGAQRGYIMAGESLSGSVAVAAAKAFPGLQGADLAREVSTEKAYE